MALAPGTRLGSYEIIAPLGAGGMGEVYRAKDTRLGRSAAIKTLPPEFALDEDRRARFEREAKTLATLNHPHIAQIYGLEDVPDASGGPPTLALAMELVEGEDLARRLARGPVPLDEVWPLARQIAEGLEAAHEAGIVHRDLKPANIRVTPEGVVKVLDFGLAKPMEPVGSGALATHSPTLTSPALTTRGVVLGTASYMAPEQAKGRPVDRRADIWAFGCVVYELLTGRRAFPGEDVPEILGAILKTEPDWSVLPAATPARVRAVLRRCLAKDRAERWQHIGDVRLALAEALAESAREADVVKPVRYSRGGWVAAGVATAVAAGALLTRPGAVPESQMSAAPTTRVSIDLGVDATLNTTETSAVLSPDGRTLVFAATPLGAARAQLFVRRLDQLQATPVPGTDGAQGPFFSPDGEWIGFFDGRQLKKAPLAGGPTVSLVSAPVSRGGFWTEAGDILLLPRAGGGTTIQRMSSAGGPLTPLIEADEASSQRWPQLLPGGRALLYTRVRAGVLSDVMVQPLPAGERRVLASGAYGRYVASGHLVFLRGGTMYGQRFDLDLLVTGGEARPLVEGVAVRGFDGAQFSIGTEGTLIYATGSAAQVGVPMEWLDSSGRVEELRGEPAAWENPAFSPRGDRLAFNVRESDSAGNIWVFDIARGVATKLTNGGYNFQPIWTPDGLHLIYASRRGAEQDLFSVHSDGSRPPRVLVDSSNPLRPGSLTRAGTEMVLQETFSPSVRVGAVTLQHDRDGNLTASGIRALVDNPAHNESEPKLSPDGRWLAFTSNQTGQDEVYVQPYPEGGTRRQISSGGGRFPVWSPSSRELCFVTESRGPAQLMAVPYAVEGTAFVPGRQRPWSPRRIWSRLANQPYDIHPDGRRVVAAVEAEGVRASGPDRLVLVTNFLDELKRLVP